MSLACLLITTNLMHRLDLLDQTIKSIEQCSSEFDQKILSIDVFDKHTRDTVDISYFKRYNWEIVYDYAHGMVHNQSRGLSKINCDKVFYCEDKVIIRKIPTKNTIDIAIKDIKYICYNMHIKEDFINPTDFELLYINNKDNYIDINNEKFLLKNEFFKDEYFLNFPASISDTKLLVELHNYALRNYPSRAGEVGISKAWFELNKNRDNKVGIYTISDIFKYAPLNLMDLFHMSNMRYWNNDPNLRPISIVECQSRQSEVYIYRKKYLEEYEKKWVNIEH